MKEWYDPKDGWQGPQLALLMSLVLTGVAGLTEPLLPRRS